MKAVIIVAIILFCCALASMGTGITLLVKRYQMEAPQHYRDESINYSERLPKSTTRIVVALDDRSVMSERVQRFIKRNGGEVEYTRNEFHAKHIKALVPLEVHRHIASLHKKGWKMSSGYAHWPGSWQKLDVSEDRYDIMVKIRGVPYHKKMLDIGVGTLMAGGVMLFFGAVFMACGIDMYYEDKKRRSHVSTV